MAILASTRDARVAQNVDYSNNNTLCVIEAENCDNGSGHQRTAGASNDATRHGLASFLDMSTGDPPLLVGCITVTHSRSHPPVSIRSAALVQAATMLLAPTIVSLQVLLII